MKKAKKIPEGVITEQAWMAELQAIAAIKGVPGRSIQYTKEQDDAIRARESIGVSKYAFKEWFRKKYGFGSSGSLSRREDKLNAK